MIHYKAELELLRKLDHVNIVKYVDFIRTPSHINIVLEFIEGGSLAVILKKVYQLARTVRASVGTASLQPERV
jgi:serine/threonine protein kinase